MCNERSHFVKFCLLYYSKLWLRIRIVTLWCFILIIILDICFSITITVLSFIVICIYFSHYYIFI